MKSFHSTSAGSNGRFFMFRADMPNFSTGVLMSDPKIRYALIAVAALVVVACIFAVMVTMPAAEKMPVLYEVQGIAIAALGAAAWKLVEG